MSVEPGGDRVTQPVDRLGQLFLGAAHQACEGVEVRVHDSTADMRYLVLPERPAGTEGWSEDRLAALVSRDSMIGVTRPDNRA